MSMLLMVQAMQTEVGNPLRKLVLIKLADNANDKGECWPSLQHIADQCEISRRSVINHINALIESGLLKKHTRKGPRGNATNVYILNLRGAGDSLGGGAGDSPRTSHSSEPVNEPNTLSSKLDDADEGKKTDSSTQACKRVIDYLNFKTGSAFRYASSHMRLIASRLKAGATEDELRQVVDRKCAEWLHKPDMRQYLRPATLFSPKNYDNYVGQLTQPLPDKGRGAVKHSGFSQVDYNAGVDEHGYF